MDKETHLVIVNNSQDGFLSFRNSNGRMGHQPIKGNLLNCVNTILNIAPFKTCEVI